jgi:MGT family glycosyltransferase
MLSVRRWVTVAAMARIALVNAPFTSHVAAMMRLAGVLVSQGHELIVWAPEDWRPRVEQLGAHLVPSSPDMPRLSGAALSAALAATTERVTEELVPQLHAHDVDLVIRDSQTPWAFVAAQYLGIPRIVSHPMFPMIGAGAEAAPMATPSAEADHDRFEQSRLSIAGRWGVELADVSGLYHTTSEPTLVFTTEEVIGDHALPPGWRCIGPLLGVPPAARRADDPPVVYASFGTAQNRRTELFRLVIAALAGRPVELVISAGGRRLTREDVGPLPANVIVHEYAPTRAMLARASVHITHGGCNSVHESLTAGVPMVCLPQAFDQIPLSQRITQLGMGVVAEPEPDAVEHAVLSLLDDGAARRRTQAISERLQRYGGETQVAAAVAGCLG